MKLTTFMTGVAAGMAAGAIVSAATTNMMENPRTQRAVRYAARSVGDSAKQMAEDVAYVAKH